MTEDDEADGFDGDAVDPGVDDVRNRRKRRPMPPMPCLGNDLNGSSRRRAPCKKAARAAPLGRVCACPISAIG